ncbi:hypothetical protein IFO70_10415 [Phormidium tenue FACHB-886]|nr:hypothetical protein [Phormidium tenue FACHB-886]
MPWNITPPSDFERIRRICGIPVNNLWLDNLRIAMASVEKQAPEAVATIQALLTQYDQVKAQRLTQAKSKEAGLTYKKVDVLEWEWGDRGNTTDSLSQLESEIKQEIALTLGMDMPGGGGSGSTLLERS